MTRSTIPRVAVDLDELDAPRTRHLRYDLNALADIKDCTGIDLLQAQPGLTLGAKELTVFIWAGLRWEEEALTIRQVGRMIGTGNIVDVMAKFQEAYAGAFPAPTPGETTGGDAPPLAGSASGASDATTSDSPTPSSGA